MMRRSMFLLINGILLLGLATTSMAAEKVVKVAGDPYPPWSIGEAGSKPQAGIAFDIARELFARMGLRTRDFIYPFKRGIERIKDGEEDIILMVSHSPERDDFMLFTLPIREVRFVFYHAAEREFDWSDWQDLKPFRIGAVSGYNIGKQWPAAIVEHGLEVEEVKTDLFNMKKLLAGRIDLFITDHEVMQRTIDENPEFRGKFKWHEKIVFESLNNLGISKKSFLASELDRINRHLAEMKRDGSFQRIFCNYGKAFSGSCG